LQVPGYPWLLGTTVHATAVTFDWPRFPLLRTVMPRSLAITIR